VIPTKFAVYLFAMPKLFAARMQLNKISQFKLLCSQIPKYFAARTQIGPFELLGSQLQTISLRG
jgi:hypothetical protein